MTPPTIVLSQSLEGLTEIEIKHREWHTFICWGSSVDLQFAFRTIWAISKNTPPDIVKNIQAIIRNRCEEKKIMDRISNPQCLILRRTERWGEVTSVKKVADLKKRPKRLFAQLKLALQQSFLTRPTDQPIDAEVVEQTPPQPPSKNPYESPQTE